MNDNTLTTRRAALVGALASTAALAAPLVARASAATSSASSAPASPVPALAAAYAAAEDGVQAAHEAYKERFKAFREENERDPVLVDLPGFRFNMAHMPVMGSSPYSIEERYRQHYTAGKTGARMTADGWQVIGAKELAAEQARDLAAALANWKTARGVLDERATGCGLKSAEQRLDAAADAQEAAWFALLSYVPTNLAEVREKAAAVLVIAKAQPVQMDDERTELFLRSLLGEVA